MQAQTIQDVYELTPLQAGILFDVTARPESRFYQEQYCFSIRGVFQPDAFIRSWRRVVDRNEILRTSFLWGGVDKPVQIVSEEVELPFEELDWRGLPESERQWNALLEADRHRGFELSKAPLMRCVLARIDDNVHRFLWSHHHLLLDGWSLPIVLREVLSFYEAFCQGSDLELECAPAFRDYILWLQRQDMQKAEQFWRQALRGFTTPVALGIDSARGNDDEMAAPKAEVCLGEAETRKLEGFARRHLLTMNTLVQGAWAVLLSRYSGQQDVVFGATVSGRSAPVPGIETMVGLCINTLPVRTQVDSRDVLSWLRELQAFNVELRQYEHTPLTDIQGWSELARNRHLFESILVFQNYPFNTAGDSISGIEIDDIQSFSKPNFALTLAVDGASNLNFQIFYDRTRYERVSITNMLEHLKVILSQMMEHPEQAVSELQVNLPEYMIPSSFELFRELPLTPNGKVGRQSIGAQKPAGTEIHSVSGAPQNPTQEILADIWATVLNIGSIGIHDDFFDLGGHSLSAVQIVGRLHEAFEVDIPVRCVLEERTIASLARRIDAARTEAAGIPRSPIMPCSRDSELSVSFAQLRLWLLNRMQPLSSSYNVPFVLRLRGELDVKALAQSIGGIIRRHEALRTRFAAREDEPIQIIDPPSDFTLDVLNFADLPEQEREQRLAVTIRKEASLPFDLAQGPLIRCSLIGLDPLDHALLLTMHHIVCDGWSLGILVHDLNLFYQAYSNAEVPQLPPLSIQYADYAAWQRAWLDSGGSEIHLEYWKAQLAGAPVTFDLPFDYPRPPVQNTPGAVESLVFPPALLTALKGLSRQEGVTLFMTLLAGFEMLLYRCTGREDFVVGVPFAGRSHPDTKDLFGFFVNTLPLRADCSGMPTPAEVLGRVRATTLDAHSHQDLPFERLVESLKLERTLSQNPLFQVSFVLQNSPLPQMQLPGIHVETSEMPGDAAKFDLTLVMTEAEDGLAATIEYSTGLFRPQTIQRMLGHLRSLLEGMVADPFQSASEIPMLTSSERRQQLETWNNTSSKYPRESSVHRVFEVQAREVPNNVALVCGGRTVTYEELNAHANRISNDLRRLGVGPEARIGICAERSVEMIAGLLGILKTGAAYVPLDPGYPRERIAYILRDARVHTILAQTSLFGRLDECMNAGIKLLDIGAAAQQIAVGDLNDPPDTCSPDQLAYVMYTSGSTGQPKGVAVTHRNIVRLIRNTNYVELGSDETLLQFAPISFDASTFEIWSALLNGARLVLAGPGQTSISGLADLIATHHVSTLWLTAGLFQHMASEDSGIFANVRQLLVGGDVLSPPHVKKILQDQPELVLINGYGPTENTTFTACHPIDRCAEQGPVPIGRPIANTRVYVLDVAGQLVPIGVTGEIFAGGDGVARGYLDSPAATAEKFIPDPFSTEPGARLYRTGDLGRWRTDGNLEFIGRFDSQVKIRGFRVELGEIESVIGRHPGVRECAALVQEDDLAEKRIVAYVAAKPNIILNLNDLRQYVEDTLPKYMIPTTFHMLPELPLTPNGKVDRKELAKMKGSGAELAGYIAPRTPVELRLAQIWQDTLKCGRVGVTDHFFLDHGGHSLLALTAASRIEKGLGVKVSIGTIFQNPTVETMAQLIERQGANIVNSPLVPIQPKGSKRPLFCIHPGPGSAFCFIELAHLLDRDRPFYGFQSQGISGDQPPLETIEEMAALYLQEIKKVQPKGPYLIGGYCFGALVAFEIVQRLHSEGEEISAMIVIDGEPPLFNPEDRDHVLGAAIARAHSFSSDLLDMVPSAARIIERQTGRKLSFDSQAYSKQPREKQLDYFLQSLRAVGFFPPDADLLHGLGMLRTFKANVDSVLRYIPRSRYMPRLVCFHAADWNPEDQGREQLDKWSEHFPDQVELIKIPGDHVSIMSKPHVEVLATRMMEILKTF